MPPALDPDLLAQLPPALRAAVEAQVQALAEENVEQECQELCVSGGRPGSYLTAVSPRWA
jgi:hypothetical protein